MKAARRWMRWTVILLVVTNACGNATGTPDQRAPEGAEQPLAAQEKPTEAATEGPQQFHSFDPELALDEEWVGDLDGMVERGHIRALVVYSLGQYFLDGATQRGTTYEALAEFERFLNKRLGRRKVKVAVLVIPVQRDEVLPALERGLGDIAAANLTITNNRLEQVAFSDPLLTDIREVVVTGPDREELRTLEDLAGREISVRRSSSYWRSLERLNEDLRSRDLTPVVMAPVDEFLQDEDLLEMVNAGLLPATIVDSHKATFWAQILDQLVVHEDLAVRTGSSIGWAFRKNSPQLSDTVNAYVKKNKQGTLHGNVVLNRYLKNRNWARKALAGEDRARFERTVGIFKEFGNRYDFDHLMLAALAYQESGLDQSVRSAAGAVGIMQVLPTTAADPKVGIPDITTVENNIHAGTKYLRFLRNRYFSDPAIDEINQTLFSFAAYNAGPARVRKLREEASKNNLDPNVWFGNVEHVAAKRIGRETVRYVSNIAKYYVAYRLASRHLQKRGGGPS